MDQLHFCAQLSGLSLTVISVSMLVRPRRMIAMVERMLESPPLLFVLGVVQVIAGLGLILTQNVSDGAMLPLVITLVGWWLLIRGTFLLFLTQDALWSLVDAVELPKYHFATNACGLAVGAYLTCIGFSATLGLMPLYSMLSNLF